MLAPTPVHDVDLASIPETGHHRDMPGSSRVDWLLFILLGFLWGSSYLFIKIGVDAGLQPFTLVMLRLLIGFALLAAVVAIARERLPRDARTYGHLVVMGFFSVALPFALITWAEQSVDSALAAILTAAVPLFVIPIAAIALRDERITLNRIFGVADSGERRQRAERHHRIASEAPRRSGARIAKRKLAGNTCRKFSATVFWTGSSILPHLHHSTP